MKIIITSGHDRSLHTIALIDQLLKDGHTIALVLMVKTFQIKRFRSYLKQYGFKTIVAKFKSHFLHQADTYLAKETAYIKNYIKSQNITAGSVSNFCTKANIPVCMVDSLASEKAVEQSKNINPDIIVYSGGGIVRQHLIETSKNAVLNAHSGPLPKIRGMNGIEWSIIKGIEPTTTIHLIDAGIDTGNIIYSEKIPIQTSDDIYDIRGKATVHNIKMLSKVLSSFSHYIEKSFPQKKAAGKQYFVMHQKMKNIVQNRLNGA